jgi:hypothetical protein
MMNREKFNSASFGISKRDKANIDALPNSN